MDERRVIEFLSKLGCSKITVGSGWVRSTCPLGELHSGGRDRNPSFGISIHPNDASQCKCLTCDTAGDLNSLVWRLDIVKGVKRPDLLYFLAEHNQLDTERWNPENKELAKSDLRGRLKRAKRYVVDSTRMSNFVPPDEEPQARVPEELLQKMVAALPAPIIEYLTTVPDKKREIEGRGLDNETIMEWELGWHPAERRICIPIRDEDGNLVSISGRRFGGGGKTKYIHSPFKRNRILYGANKRVKDFRKGYLVEGFFHVMYTWRHGYRNFVARMGTHLDPIQANKLADWFDHLVIVPDAGKAGLDSANLIAASLRGRVSVVEVATLPRGKDVDDLDPEHLEKSLGPRFTS